MYKILSTCKGGGYMYCKTDPPHPKRNRKGLYALHRVIKEIELGRSLGGHEHVHHKNGDKADNSPENLCVLTVAEHTRHHRKNAKEYDIGLQCRCCGKYFSLTARGLRSRKKQNLHGIISCSHSCGAKIVQLIKKEGGTF